MERRTFMALVSGGLLTAPLMLEAQQVGKVYRLGVLTPGVRPSSPVTTANLLPLILRDLGYVEGKNLLIEQRFAEGKLDRLPGLARELVQLRMDGHTRRGQPASGQSGKGRDQHHSDRHAAQLQ